MYIIYNEWFINISNLMVDLLVTLCPNFNLSTINSDSKKTVLMLPVNVGDIMIKMY